MPDHIKVAVDALHSKAVELIEERHSLRRRLLEDSVRDQQIERDLSGCIAGARALGFELDLPAPKDLMTPQRQNATQILQQGRNQIAQAFPFLKAEFEITDENAEDEQGVIVLKPEMPRIADVILERLRAAGESGSKAADIRRYILRTYDADIHEKSVGMTLYRLSQATPPQVHRRGFTWFFSPPPADEKNPGAPTPGLATRK